MSGLEGLAGTPQRVASPTVATSAGNLDDLMGLSNGGGQANGDQNADILGGFASLDMNAATQPPPPPKEQLMGDGQAGGGKKTNQDLLDLF